MHLIGDRREHFETSKDVLELFCAILRERKAREFDPTIVALQECVEDPDYHEENTPVQSRIKETLTLMTTLSDWSEEVSRLAPTTLMRLMKLGSKIQKLVSPWK